MATLTVHFLAANLTSYAATARPLRVMSVTAAAYPHVFQLTYTYEARKPGVKDKIVDMTVNGTGVRATARVLSIDINTVLRPLKTQPKASNC